MSQTPDARVEGLATSADIADVLMLAQELRETNNRRLSDALWRVGRSADHYLAEAQARRRADETYNGWWCSCHCPDRETHDAKWPKPTVTRSAQ